MSANRRFADNAVPPEPIIRVRQGVLKYGVEYGDAYDGARAAFLPAGQFGGALHVSSDLLIVDPFEVSLS